jgi:putative glycosyltransferase (TIGR04348 family)
MRIVLITPFLPVARNGNAHTAVRWDRFLRQVGHRVSMAVEWDENPADLMIALHARRSHAVIARFKALQPNRPVILVLTGTDVYRDIHSNADARDSLALAHCIVTLQEHGPMELPEALRRKASVIYQSSPRLQPARRPIRTFDICVAAHLRDEKDPFRAALATRLLPVDSRIRIHHVGGPLEAGMAEQAQQFAAEIPRWHWLGARSHGETRRRIARSHLLVLSSRMEGGANVICEAVMAGTPVLASRIPGNVGMLGSDYAGYFPLGDEAALAELMLRAETDPEFYRRLADQCAARMPLFEPVREASAVQALAKGCQ